MGTGLPTLIAILKAISIYIISYFVTVNVLVIWKWRSWDDMQYAEVETINPPLPDDLPSSSQYGIEEMEELVDAIKALPKIQGMARVDELLDEYREALSQWDEVTDWMASFLASNSILKSGKQGVPSSTRNFMDNLLQKSSLANLTDEHLESLLNGTKTELQSIASQSKDLNWQEVHGLLLSPKAPFPKKVKLKLNELQDELCMLPSMEEEEDDDNTTALLTDDNTSTALLADDDDDDCFEEYSEADLALYASEDDLTAREKLLESLLDHRMTNPISHLENNTKIRAKFRSGIQDLQETIENATFILGSTLKDMRSLQGGDADDESPRKYHSNETCNDAAATDENVLAFLEAGLDALARHKDTREALIGVLQEIDPEAAKTLILDADFDTDPPFPLVVPKQFAATALLNTPMLRNLAATVDRMLDHIGGYFDPLDQYIDQLAENYVNVHSEDASSLGKVFVANLLIHSGHLKVPIPGDLREFLQKSRRGRAILASLA